MTINTIKTTIASAGLFALAIASTQAAPLITNGDFSINADNDHFVFGGYGGIPDWNFTGSGSLGVNGPNINPGYFGPTNQTSDNKGNTITDFAFIQLQTATETGTLYQSFDVTAGQTYLLSYDAAGRPNYGAGNQLVAEVTDGTTPDAGTILYQQTSPALPGDQFYANSSAGFTTTTGLRRYFTADTTGEVTLAFTVNNTTSESDVSLDFTNVSVNEVVPEPSTYALLLASLGALAFVARRKALRA